MRIHYSSLLMIPLALAMVGVNAKNAFAQDAFGAIAYSPDDRAAGWTYNYSTRSRAEANALSECRGAGGESCRVLVWFKNGCGALAVASSGAYGSGWGSSKQRAELEALKSCGQYDRGCRVTRWVCTDR